MIEVTSLYRNTKKSRNLLLYASLVTIILALVLIYSLGIFDGIFKIKVAVFSGAILLFMLFLTLKNLISLRDKSPLFQLDATGFYGKTTPLSKSFGRVEWVDVTNIQLQKTGGDTLVITTLTNTEKYTGRISKMMWNMAYDKTKSELNLMYSSSEVDVDAEELYELFISYWKNQQ